MTDIPRTPESILSELFCVQVPPNTPKSVKQRLFTLAARDNADKVIGKPEVAALLEQVGAIAPTVNGLGHIDCLGVLWSRDHAVCKNCESQLACRAMVTNFGLNTIKISPRLLGIKITRTPRLFPTVTADDARYAPSPDAPQYMVYPSTDRDMELLEFLNSIMRPVLRFNEIMFNVKGTTHYPISVGKPGGLMEIRFCAPAPPLQSVLKERRSTGPSKWLLPDATGYDEATSLINTHIQTLLDANESSHS